MTARSKKRTPEQLAAIAKAAPPGKHGTLWRVQRAGIAHEPTKAERERHVHPRRMRKK